MLKKIACLIGTRPQLVKHSVLLKHLQKKYNVTTINTSQHYDYELNDLLTSELYVQQNFIHLSLQYNNDPTKRLGEMIIKLREQLENTAWDAVIVYGDTDTTLAGALVANKSGITLVHIEAGERSYNKAMPEESNRMVTDSLSDILFCASEKGISQLQQEGKVKNVFYSGDLMKDLLLETAAPFKTPPLTEQYYYCTIHRNYTNKNLQKLTELLHALAQLKELVIFPIHPATLKSIEKLEIDKSTISNIRFLSPLKYSSSIHYQKFAKAVITDSGGIQKEAYWLQRPCITIRKETEWTDTLIGNWNTLLYEDLNQLPNLIHTNKTHYNNELYGKGTSGEIIINTLALLI